MISEVAPHQLPGASSPPPSPPDTEVEPPEPLRLTPKDVNGKMMGEELTGQMLKAQANQFKGEPYLQLADLRMIKIAEGDDLSGLDFSGS